jgi:DNA-binding response OmpR family regulator
MEQICQEASVSVLDGSRLLVVEDEFLVLLDLETTLRDAGAADVIAARNVEDGLAAVHDGGFDAAILDVRLGRQNVAPVAQALAERGLPFLFYTGQVSDQPTLGQWPNAAVVAKPALASALVAAVASLLGR